VMPVPLPALRDHRASVVYGEETIRRDEEASMDAGADC
jgi:hypothetical protein